MATADTMDLVVQNQRALAEFDPELAKLAAQNTAKFMDNVHEEDIGIPRIKLMQPTSNLVAEDRAKAGTWVHVTDGHAYTKKASEPFLFVPVYHWMSRMWRKHRETEGEGIHCQSLDSKVGLGPTFPGADCIKCEKREWRQNSQDPDGKNLPPLCVKQHNWVVLIPGSDAAHSIGIICFEKTHEPYARWFNDQIRGLSGAPFFHAFLVGSELHKDGSNKWFEPVKLNHPENDQLALPVLAREDWKLILPPAKLAREKFEAEYLAKGGLVVDYSDEAGATDVEIVDQTEDEIEEMEDAADLTVDEAAKGPGADEAIDAEFETKTADASDEDEGDDDAVDDLFN